MIDATANNAILEAIAPGHPVITFNLASSRWHLDAMVAFTLMMSRAGA